MEHAGNTSRPDSVSAFSQQSHIDDALEHDGPNDHLALVYEDRERQFATAIPFVREGLERGERCLYVVDDNATTDVVDAMEAAGIDVAAAREGELLSIETKEDTYLREGTFDPEDMIGYLGETVTEAIEEQGFEHVRITGEMTWVLDGDRETDRDALAEYEARLNEHLPDEAVTALCQYNRERFSSEVLRDVVRTHPQIVYDGGLWQNFWYVPPTRFFDERASETAFDRRVETLFSTGDGVDAVSGGREGASALTVASGELQSADPATIRRQALANAAQVLDTERVAICLYDESGGTLEPCATAADEFDPDRFEDVLWETFVTNRTRVLDGASGARTPESDDLVVVPLGRHGVFVAAADAGALGTTDVTFAETVGANVRAALERADRQALLDETESTAARDERTDRLATVTDLTRDLLRSIVDASSREELRRSVCDRLVDVESWRLAWIGTTNATSEHVVERTAAGSATAYLDDATVAVADERATDPAGRAAATRSVQVTDDVRENGSGVDWRRAAEEQGLRSVASVPLVYEGVSYGVLTVYGDERGAFGELERDALDDVGSAVAFACNAMERREALVSDRAVELDLRVPSDPFFVSFVGRTGGSVSVEGTVPENGSDGDDGAAGLRTFLTVREATRDEVDAAAAESSFFRSLSLVAEREEELLYDGVVPGGGLLGTLLDHGAVPKSIAAADDEGRLVVRVPPSTDVASFVTMLDDRYPGTELRARQSVERTRETRHDFRSLIEDELTERQWDALRTAYLSGYFEWPREQSGEEVGARLDVSQPTFNRHLRDALRKALTPIFDDE